AGNAHLVGRAERPLLARSGRLESRRNMARHAPRCDQYGVEAQVTLTVLGMAREPRRRGGGNAALLSYPHRLRRVVGPVARLDPDEHQETAAPCDQIDLAHGAAPATGHDAEALDKQQGRGPRFRRQSEPEGDLTLGSRGAVRRSSAARPVNPRYHRRGSW